jgi:hypothetical protein
MNASLRDLGKRTETVSAPQLDVAALVAAGESRIRRRRLAVVAAVTAAVLVVVGGALLTVPDTRDTQPPPAGPDHKKHGDGVVQTQLTHRLLTYSVGTTIHWGDKTIDVRQQTNRRIAGGKLLDYVDATDNGAVFVTGQAPVRDSGGWGLPYGPAAVWFTDGSAPMRIGTTSGSRIRGFEIAPTTMGSTLAWIDPGTRTRPGAVVVYDTAQTKELARLGDADAVPLAVYDDVVYWSPDGGACQRYLPSGAAYGCTPTARVMRFDTATGRQSRVSTADYDADRRARPGLLTGRSDDHQIRRGVIFLSFVRRGTRLVAGGTWQAGEPGFASTVALTGQPIRLRHPARDAAEDDDVLQMTQWLDPDRVVLLDDYDDETDLVNCRLSTGECRVTVRVANRNFTAPGPRRGPL